MQIVEEIPKIGLGTYCLKGIDAYNMTLAALNHNYRHIDTAKLYRNEKEIGRAIKDSGIPRREIFITTKIWIDDIEKGRSKIIQSVMKSLKNLDTDYIDLVLLHAPPHDDKIAETWKVLEDIYNKSVVGLENKVKHIGVSNYDVHHLQILLDNCRIKPYVNQFEVSPFLTRKELVNFCNMKGIKIVAHTSLIKGKKFDDIELKKLAESNGMSISNLLLCWALHKNFIILPRTSKIEHLQDNIKCLDRKIDQNVIELMDTYNINYAIHRKYLGRKFKKDELLDLFYEFFSTPSYYNDFNLLCFPHRTKIEFDINKLTITNSITKMKELYEKFGIIIFRDYAGEDELIIGCGNYPLANSGGYPFANENEEDNYHKEHHHTNCYTINPVPCYNPGVVGAFNIHVFKNIPDCSFKYIEIEGVYLDETEAFYSEMTRLLKEGGIVSSNGNDFMMKKNGKLETLDNIKLSDYIKLKPFDDE
jgi:diketogulonate reductase-like aldo/keto reductase